MHRSIKLFSVLVTTIYLFTVAHALAQLPNFEWAARMGSTNYDQGEGIAVDASGNVFTTGYFIGTADFDPGVGVFNLTSAGGRDIFITKLDANGVLVWAKQIGGTGDDHSFTVSLDNLGNIYMSGYFQSIVDFDPGPATFNLSAAGSVDMFLVKLDVNGDFLWANRTGSTGAESTYGLSVDNSGNSYITGFFNGTVDFDPGAGVSNLTSAGSYDAFITKLNTNGEFIWARRIGATELDEGRSVTSDNAGNVYLTGYFRTTVDFDPGASVYNLTSAGDEDIYICKLDVNGNFVWAVRMGEADFDTGQSIIVDGTNLYSTGYFRGTVDFDPGTDVSNSTSAGDTDIYVLKLDVDGNFVWAKTMGSTARDDGNDVAVDASGNIYTTGFFNGTVDFDPNGDVFNQTSAGGQDIFISKFSGDGDFKWATRMGGTEWDQAYQLAVDANENIYATGYYRNTVDFDPGPCTSSLSANTQNEIFVLKLKQQPSGLDPTITSVTPSFGSEGTPVSINGTNFDLLPANNTVQFNGVTATVTTSTSTLLSTTVPVGATTGKVSVGIGCVTYESVNNFTVGPAPTPTITSFSPQSGPVSTTVTINGTNFSAVPAENDVQFNGISASVTSSSPTSIVCTVPSGATTGPITIGVGGEMATSTTDFIVVGASITITTQPLSATVCDGLISSFTTVATGTTNITYQWQTRDSDGAWTNVTDVDGYSGATTSVLSINTSGIFGEGSYQCVVSGDFASDVDSNEIFLDIAPNPPDVDDAVRCGPGVVTVTASGGNNGQYRWYTQASGGTAIQGEVNSMFTTPVLTSTTVFYVAITNGVCEGPRSEVQVAISACQPQPGFVWGEGIGVGTMANGTNQGTTVLIDADGNLLVCGTFQGTIDFDNGPAIVNLTAGSTDAFLLKMTSTGTLLWAKGIGGPGSGNDGVSEMSIDGAGNIYMFFTFNGTADFDPGAGVASLTSTLSTPVNKNDLAVAKYDRDGNFIWVRRIGGNNDERSGGLKADAAGNVYITGDFRGTTNFNGSFPLTALGANSTDVLFAKLDANGTFLWAGNIGSPLTTAANLFSDGGSAIDVDGTGNVYVSGRVYGPNTTVDFDPGAGTAQQAVIDQAGFVLKLNNSGVYQNHYLVEGAAGNEVSIDASNNVYFTGAFTGTVDIDPGPGVFSVTGDGANYITKLNSSGNFVWGKLFEPNGFGVSPSVLIGGIVFDAIGDLHLTGYITTTTDFDLGPLEESRGLNGLFILNPFIWKLNANGDFNWVTNMRRISGSASASIYSVAVSPTGDIYTTGRYARTVDLDPGLCEFAVTNVNGSNIFISKFSPAQPNVCFAQQPISVTVCENDIAAFSVSVSDGASIFYQWQKFNTVTSQFENIDDSGGFSGTASNELAVNTTGNFGVGEYRCKVSGTSTVNEFSSSATLTFSAITPPSTFAASGCSGATLTLTASGGVNGEYRWYTSPTGGTPLAGETNSAYTTPVLTVTTTYYVALNNGSCESTRTPVIATVGTGCSFTITNQPGAVSVCSGANAAFTTSATGTTNITYQWQFSPDGTTPFTDIVNGGGYGNATTSTLSINTTGNFGIGKYRCYITGDFATPAITNEAELTVESTPPAPVIADVERCGEGPVTLSVLGGAAGQYRWHTVSSGGTTISGEVNNVYTTPILSNTTTFYVSIINGTCESQRSPVLATIKPIPVASVTGASACPGSALTLNASGGSNGQYKWFTDELTTTPLAGEVNSTYTTPLLTETTTYFVTVTTNGCESSRTPVTATILTSGCAPEIEVASLSTVVEGTITIDLKTLITTTGTLDISSIKVIAAPASGAIASIENGILTITYSGVNFGGVESITVEACNTNGLCAQQDFVIAVDGDVVIYNGISPNDDGKNEIFVLQFIDALPSTRSNKVFIYNRWGDEVFSIADYDNKTRVFSGRNKEGNKVPSGTYYYKIHFPLQDKTVTGYLSVKY